MQFQAIHRPTCPPSASTRIAAYCEIGEEGHRALAGNLDCCAAKHGVAGTYNRAASLKERPEVLDQWVRYLTGLISAPLTDQQSEPLEKCGEIGGQLLNGTRS